MNLCLCASLLTQKSLQVRDVLHLLEIHMREQKFISVVVGEQKIVPEGIHR